MSPRRLPNTFCSTVLEMLTDLYEQTYDNAWAEVIKTTDPLDERFDALLLEAYERLLIQLLQQGTAEA